MKITGTILSGLLLAGPLGCPSHRPKPVSRGDTTSSAARDSVPAPSPLLARIQVELQKVKPDIVSTRLVSLVTAPAGRTMIYAVVAKGTGPHRGWTRIEDVGEIFGVFWVDSTLTRPSAPLDIFPSPRLSDYDVWLQRAWGGSVVVCGEGASYGDGPMRRVIEAEPDAGTVGAITVDTSLNVPLEKRGDASCGSSGPKGD